MVIHPSIITNHVIATIPSVFFMEKEEAVTIESNQEGLSILAKQQGLLVKRLVKTYHYPYAKAIVGGFIVSQFIEQAIKACIERRKDDSWQRTPSNFHSPAELIPFATGSTKLRRGRNLSFSEIEYAPAQLDAVDGPTMPSIQCDRLTISSEPSVWNHFEMCASIASSRLNPVVSMLTTEDGTIQIHASNDHEEYRAEIVLIGGEPPSRQAIGIPVALIDEVSYWIENGLHTESHLDIWFDENYVKFGTKANQVLAAIEAYQPQKYDWQSKPSTLIKEMSESDRQILKSLLYESSNEQLECNTPRYYAPLIEFYLTVEHLFLGMSSYQPSVKAVRVGITELRDFVEYLDITQAELTLKIEVNAEDNSVIFFGDFPCQESKAVIHFSYLLLGVLPDTKKGEENTGILGDANNQSLFLKRTEEWVDWTRENFLTIEGIKFIERFPLDFRRDSRAKRNSKQWQSLAKQEPPFNNLIQLIKDLKNEIGNFLEVYSMAVTEMIKAETNGIEFLHIETLDILETFKSKYPSDYQNYLLLAQIWNDLNDAVNQTKPKMFDPEATNTLMQTLEMTYKDAQWVYFTFLNEYCWGNENPRLWQQTFAHCPTVDNFETAITARVNLTLS